MERIGRYRVIRPLGHGGMGAVFLAHDPTLERDVALKLLHHEPTRSGLRDEAVALAALSHPGIVTVFEIGEHEGQDFIAMEYLPGRSLREVLQAGTATRAELLAICAKVALAVEAAHRAGILHRDIKPENVVVAATGEIKVVDFGLARRLEHAAPARSARPATASEVVAAFKRRTLPAETLLGAADTEVSAGTQTMFGTPAYMAPEVLLGDASAPASDVFSLGITIYECLAGHRPYTATSLVEVIAQTIEGPPPTLADPLGALVDRMRARDPAQRPALAEVARALQRPATVPAIAPPPTRRSRAPLVFAALVGAGALVLGAWWLARPTGAAVAVAPAPAPFVDAALAVAPFALTVPGYGVEPPSATATADVLARLFGEVSGARLVGLTLASADPGAARALGAAYLVRGAIAQEGAVLRARLELVTLATSTPLALPVIERSALAPLLDAIAAAIAHALAPGATLSPAPNRVRAQMFSLLGKPVLEAGRFTEARPYFEQAVDADPSLFDGWYALALVLGWMDAPEDRVRDATSRAMALAPPGPQRELIAGVGRFLAGDFAGARAVLEPLDHPPASRELLYYLGEASWHDGRHAAAAAYFARTLELDRAFRPATVHAWQYAVVRRDAKAALYYVGLASESHEWIDLAAGHYAELARTGSPPRKLEAELVLGQLDAPDVVARLAADDVDGATYRVAVAIAQDDPARARAAFAAAFAAITANRDPNALPAILYGLEALGEVVISAELPDESRQLVAFLAAHSAEHPARGYPRLAILAAGVTGDRALLVRAHGTERTAALATAITAELAGDRAAAARQLQALVDDPTFTFDYPERAALLRDLAALHDRKRFAAVCADTLRPAIVRPALLVLQHRCAHRP